MKSNLSLDEALIITTVVCLLTATIIIIKAHKVQHDAGKEGKIELPQYEVHNYAH